jgi:hypothetical protein
MNKDSIYEILKMKPPKKGGEQARLFPVLSESSKEGRAASIFLACLSLVPEFADKILQPLGRKIGSRSKVYCLTEICFDESKANRPDGLVGVVTSGNVWKSLLEFKVGGELTKDQVERYLRVAKDAKMDAVITISNDIVPAPDVSPVIVDKRLVKTVSLFHISWMQIFTHAQMLIANNNILDSDHAFIIEEFLRFLMHPSTGIKGFTQMPSEWPVLIDKARSIGNLNKNGKDEQSVINGWMQEERELSFIMSQKTGAYCRLKRNRVETGDVGEIIKNHMNRLCGDYYIESELLVSNAAAPLQVKADLKSRTISFSMRLSAPQDKTRLSASVNWLLRQIPNDIKECDIVAHWSGRTPSTRKPVEVLREGQSAIISTNSSALPTAFEVSRVISLGAKFSSRKGVISALEAEVVRFYTEIGENLSEWTPKPSKTMKTSVAEEIADKTTFYDKETLNGEML